MEDYEPNPITGSCVKKTEKIPEITWKDLFRLQLNQRKIINGREVYGTALMLRGITQSEINTGHAFLVNLIYDLKYTRNYRILEEQENIPLICEIIDNVDESDEPNIVEYDCITNLTKYENDEIMSLGFELSDIEVNEDNYNSGLLKNDNLKKIINETNISNLAKKTKPDFGLNNFESMATFTPNDMKDLILEKNITINGKLNKELKVNNLTVELNLAHNDQKVFAHLI